MATIYAVSSGNLPAAIAVLRITGPAAIAAATALAGTLPEPRRAGLRALRDADGGLLDRALVLVFPEPDSATGDDLVELHLHGGRAIVAAVSDALARMPGLRAAEAGEFTRRALINGRIDLAEAEGLGDLLSAETEGQRVAALSAAEGVISTRVRGWFDRITALSAEVEAELDFSDEDDVATEQAGIAANVAHIAADMDRVLAEPPVERVRNGISVVLAGPPNSGKSTLLNCLAGREAAIVSPIAGTTRDRIDAPVVRAGIAYLLTDTAGLAHDTGDAIEAIGVDLAERAILSADILLWLGDDPPPRADAAIWLYPRADLRERDGSASRQRVSRDDRASIAAVWRTIVERARMLLPREDALMLNRRQRACVERAAASLRQGHDDPLIIAEHLRLARNALAELLGVQSTDAMLDALFGRFCIGK